MIVNLTMGLPKVYQEKGYKEWGYQWGQGLKGLMVIRTNYLNHTCLTLMLINIL